MERITRPDPVSVAAVRRIGLALLLSAALHLILMLRLEPGGPVGGNLPDALHARLDLRPAPAGATSPRIRTPLTRSPPPAGTPTESAAPLPVEQPGADVETQVPPAPEPVGESVHVPVDPVYYAARELDVYPVPLERLQGPAVAASGWVRVLAMVDETGAVTQADVFDSDPDNVAAEAALQAVRAARFSPARKGGRAVRSRILIELRFGENE